MEWLHPGRIDLGLGRAPGTDQIAVRAMRCSPEFPQELQAFLAPAGSDQRIIAVPAAGTNVPLWILDSSNFGAMLAAERSLPYAFASHFAPDLLLPALDLYRRRFKPSEQLDRPHAMPASTSSPRIPTLKQGGSQPPSKCPSPTSSAAGGAYGVLPVDELDGDEVEAISSIARSLEAGRFTEPAPPSGVPQPSGRPQGKLRHG